MKRFARALAATLGRELRATFLSPVYYVLAAVFLVAEGYGFAVLCQALADGGATVGVALRHLFGGSLLFFLLLLLIVALLSMRLFAEERQSGTLELLLTSPAPEGALVLGKYLGALLAYAGLFLPTLAYVGLLSVHAAERHVLDAGAIASGYAGLLLFGGSALALGLLFSLVAPTQLLAAALTFVALSLWLFAGLARDHAAVPEALRGFLERASPFAHLEALSQGIVDGPSLLLHLGLAGAALLYAARLLRQREGALPPGPQLRRLGEGLLVALAFVAVQLIVAPRLGRLDVSSRQQHALAPRTQAALATLAQRRQAVHATLVRPAPGELDELWEKTAELLRFAAADSRGALSFSSLRLDQAESAGRLALLAERQGVAVESLRAGALIVAADATKTPTSLHGVQGIVLVDRELAELAPVPAGAPPRLLGFRGESALLGALLRLLDERPRTVCLTGGHGEAEYDSLAANGASLVAQALRGDGFLLRGLRQPAELTSLPTACDVVAILGPERAFLPEEAAALARYLDGGGRLLLLSGALIDRELSHFLPTGLEALLVERGITLEPALALDPKTQVGSGLAFLVEDGYAAHAVTASLAGRRTLWPLSRPISPTVPTLPSWQSQGLVQTSEEGFATTDLESLRSRKLTALPPEPRRAVSLAVAAQGPAARIVALGSAQLSWNDSLALYNRDLLVSAVRWLTEQPTLALLPARHPEELRLLLSARKQRQLFFILTLGLPLMALLLGVGIRALRKRE